MPALLAQQATVRDYWFLSVSTATVAHSDGFVTPPVGELKAFFIDRASRTTVDGIVQAEYYAVGNATPPASVFSETTMGIVSVKCAAGLIQVRPIRSYDDDGRPVGQVPPLDGGPEFFDPLVKGSWEKLALTLICSSAIPAAPTPISKVPMNQSLPEFAERAIDEMLVAWRVD